ncbi:voltage-gated chloride channel family protein [Deminuibacter soli]|uniref:Voltage-gated chloride channel protein n=1 Tax=Deminuibacter soli TaxID=2291815 RepID=A0A3E1NIF2_9BACT|nr:voltage-gated chloride channel family protein [Deminuibacter soli]RFM27709.1 voltage-gated chloride channel protein [Deminuibacter soli]
MRMLNTPLSLRLFIALFRWTLLAIPVAIATGSAVALFLWLLDVVTRIRWAHEWLLFLLPAAGIAIYFLYQLWGKNSEKGNNLIIDEIHEPGGGVPKRMAPLVLLSTLITHLFGGSAGREGTAVQMGGSIAGMFGKWFRLTENDLQILLMAGIAAGFGAVFGTPLTGTIFAMEVLTVGKLSYKALLPCLVASIAGDFTCAAWGLHHTQYHIHFHTAPFQLAGLNLPLSPLLLVYVIGAGAAFGFTAYLFAESVHRFKQLFNRYVRPAWLVPVAGGCLVIVLRFILNTPDYLGLGVTSNHAGGVSLVNAFTAGGADSFSWLWKLLFTAITLGSGFKGGEVTPLFFIGATLGNTLAILLHAPVDLFAALGFIAVFAGATNTPLACTVMGVELFGGEHIVYFAIACFTAYFFSGDSSIYSAQRKGIPKLFH